MHAGFAGNAALHVRRMFEMTLSTGSELALTCSKRFRQMQLDTFYSIAFHANCVGRNAETRSISVSVFRTKNTHKLRNNN